MNITLLGQGFEPISEFSVGKKIIKFLADPSFHTFTGISAFASPAGINGLSHHIENAKSHIKIITIVTGVDQKGTSKEALEALLDLDINAFIFYQRSFPIFHPKIYLFEGENKTELIIGSSNLTAQGLFANVETSLLVSVDNSKESDREIVRQLKDYFKGIFDYSDPNLKRLSKELIDELVKEKIVPTEAERKAAHDKDEKTEREDENTERIISKIFPKREIPKIPREFRSFKIKNPSTKIIVGIKEQIFESGKLVWTGSNDFFTVPLTTVEEYGLEAYARPMVGRSVQVNSVIFEEQDWTKNKHSKAKAHLLVFPDRKNLDKKNGAVKYIEHGESLGIHKGYKTGIRDDWFVVPSLKISEALFIRRNNLYPRLIINKAGAYTTDTMHRVFIRPGTNIEALTASYYNSLSLAFTEVSGRSHGGGVLELMPNEAERILLPYHTDNSALLLQIDQLIRSKTDIGEVLKITNEIILKKHFGLTNKEINLAHSIWKKLSSRRLNRGK